MNREKIVNDAIFGFITLKPYIIAIIDTPEFQRLRMIWQLGLTPFVYPTAAHSRFEHSIGTYSLASRIITKIKNQLEEENADIIITKNDVICVEIAALCHDIGHGPFSHFWDEKVLPNICNGSPKHEDKFDEIWKTLKRNKNVRKMMKKYNLTEIEEKLISAIIKGTVIKGKEILFSIVSNAESGMDVDKWDYLARDSTYLGHSATSYHVDIDRMLHFIRAIKDGDEKWKLAFKDTEKLNVIRVFQLRHYLYQTAYRHRVTVGLELLMLDGIKRCLKEKYFSIEEISTASWILKNTDFIFWSHIEEIEEFKRILCRDLYKLICEAVKYKDIGKAEEKIENIKKDLAENNVKTENVRFGLSKFSLGNTETNPIYSIPFYKKNDDKKIFKYTKENIPSNLNINLNESRLIIFLTSFDGVDNIDKLKEALKEYLDKDGWEVELNYEYCEEETDKK